MMRMSTTRKGGEGVREPAEGGGGCFPAALRGLRNRLPPTRPGAAPPSERLELGLLVLDLPRADVLAQSPSPQPPTPPSFLRFTKHSITIPQGFSFLHSRFPHAQNNARDLVGIPETSAKGINRIERGCGWRAREGPSTE